MVIVDLSTDRNWTFGIDMYVACTVNFINKEESSASAYSDG